MEGMSFMRQSGSVRYAPAAPGLYEQPEELFGLGQETTVADNSRTLAVIGLVASIPIGIYIASKTAKLIFGLIPVFVAGVSLGYLVGARK
jgi:hypothetical protein